MSFLADFECFVNEFESNTEQMFGVLFESKTELSQSHQIHPPFEIVIYIESTGEVTAGYFLSLSKETLCSLVDLPINDFEENPEIKEIAFSGIRELLNVVSGSASHSLSDRYPNLSLTLPQLWLIQPGGCQFSSIENLSIILHSKAGDVWLSFNLDQRKTVLHQKNLQLKIQIESAQKAEQDALNYAQARSNFLANMSHELRTPLNGILGYCQFLSETPLNDEQNEQLQIIQKSGENLLLIVNDILDISKIEAGKMELEKIPFSLRSCLHNTVSLIQVKTKSKDIEIFVDIDPQIPDQYIGDPHRLGQILLNLLGNASKFTHQGQIVVHVQLIENEILDHSNIQIAIIDTGCGIPKSAIASIFEAYGQTSASVSREYGGTGLGTTICKNLVQMMKGQIQLCSPAHEFAPTQKYSLDSQDPGSVFYFNIQLPQADAPPIFTTPLYSQNKVWIYSENPDIANLIRDQWQAWGALTQPCLSLPLSLEKLKRTPPELFLLYFKKQPDAHILEKLEHVTCKTIVFCANPFSIHSQNPLLIFTMNPPHFEHVYHTYLQKNNSSFKSPHLPLQENLKITIKDRPLKVLLAEDNEINAKLAVKMLSKMGVEYDWVINGKEAVLHVLNHDVDLILMDMQMPIMDGLTAAKTIRQNNMTLPIIALTANVLEEDKKLCFEAGMNEVITKPMQFDKLKIRLAEYAQQITASLK